MQFGWPFPNRTQGIVEQYIYILHLPKERVRCRIFKAWQILKQKIRPSATVGRRDLFRTTDKHPKSLQHRYRTRHVCSYYHKLDRSRIGNLWHSTGMLPKIKQDTLLVPAATSNPIPEQKYREKFKRILRVRILISINKLSTTFLFLLGCDVCRFLVNSWLMPVSSLTNKQKLWQIFILPRFS